MPASLISLALALLLTARPDTADDPRAIVRRALRAVEGDSAQRAAAPWQTRLARSSSDSAALLGVATIARLTYDYPTAERIYGQLSATRSTPPSRFAVYARLGLAQGLDAQGRLAEMDALLTRARADAHALRDGAAEGEALLWLGIERASTYGTEAAVALLDSAERVLPSDAQDLRAMSRCRRAHMLIVLGRPNASAELKSASELARRAGEPRAEGYCLRAEALDWRLRGKTDSALAVIRVLEALRRRVHDRAKLAEALALEADELRDKVALGEAMNVLQQALAEAQASHNLYTAASTKLVMSAIYFALNDYPAAAEHVNEAIVGYKATADTGALMMGRSWRVAVHLAAGDYATARRETMELLEFFRRTGDVPYQVELYQSLADIGTREHNWAAAAQALDTAAAIMRRHGSRAWQAEQPYERGRLALYRGELAQAEHYLNRYLAQLDSTDRIRRYETRARLAEVYARRGELARAERELTLASDELDAWRGMLADEQLRVMAFQASASEVNDRNRSVAQVLALLARGGRGTSAFELVERRRAREVADRLLQTAALSTRGSDGHVPGAPSDAPRAEPSGSKTGRLTAAEIASLIPDDSTALLEYATGAFGAPTTLFVLTRPAPGRQLVRALALPPADSLTSRIARFVALVEGGTDPSALSRSLGETLLDPALAQLGPHVTRLVIAPDGPLHRLPFDALRLADGRFAVERYAVSIAPSAAVLAALWRHDRDREVAQRPVRLLAFGDPVFDSITKTSSVRGADEGASSDVDGETYRSAFDKSGGLPRLKASAREVRLVARYAPEADVRLREGASAAYLRMAQLTGYRILHFATHALVDERSMTRTALALAPGGGESGFVGPAELAALRLDADLVVLSACRTAGGVVVDGEGVQGLTAPLLEAGARAVVASEWRVGDQNTVGFIDRFYGSLARGLPVSEALRAAKLDALRRGAPVREWAAFTAVGDPSVLIPLRLPPSPVRWWVTGAVLALGGGSLVYFYLARTRRRRVAELSSLPSSAMTRTHH